MPDPTPLGVTLITHEYLPQSSVRVGQLHEELDAAHEPLLFTVTAAGRIAKYALTHEDITEVVNPDTGETAVIGTRVNLKVFAELADPDVAAIEATFEGHAPETDDAWIRRMLVRAFDGEALQLKLIKALAIWIANDRGIPASQLRDEVIDILRTL